MKFESTSEIPFPRSHIVINIIDIWPSGRRGPISLYIRYFIHSCFQCLHGYIGAHTFEPRISSISEILPSIGYSWLYVDSMQQRKSIVWIKWREWRLAKLGLSTLLSKAEREKTEKESNLSPKSNLQITFWVPQPGWRAILPAIQRHTHINLDSRGAGFVNIRVVIVGQMGKASEENRVEKLFIAWRTS